MLQKERSSVSSLSVVATEESERLSQSLLAKRDAVIDCLPVTLNALEFLVWMVVQWVIFRSLLLAGGQWPPLLESEP